MRAGARRRALSDGSGAAAFEVGGQSVLRTDSAHVSERSQLRTVEPGYFGSGLGPRCRHARRGLCAVRASVDMRSSLRRMYSRRLERTRARSRRSCWHLLWRLTLCKAFSTWFPLLPMYSRRHCPSSMGYTGCRGPVECPQAPAEHARSTYQGGRPRAHHHRGGFALGCESADVVTGLGGWRGASEAGVTNLRLMFTL
jgi:hypothetical protein